MDHCCTFPIAKQPALRMSEKTTGQHHNCGVPCDSCGIQCEIFYQCGR